MHILSLNHFVDGFLLIFATLSHQNQINFNLIQMKYLKRRKSFDYGWKNCLNSCVMAVY